PRRRPLRRSGAGPLLGARARVPARHLRLRGRADGEDMLRDTREGVLVSEGDERGLARVERTGTDELLATGETSLISLTHQHTLTRIPQHVLDLLKPIPDPVRL